MITCPHCGYGAYYNPKPVAAAIPGHTDGRIVLLKRGFEPGKGLWTFPGGFVDLGESVEEAAAREIEEEIEVEARDRGLVGVYSRPDDRVILIVYEATITQAPQTTPEATEVEAFAAQEHPVGRARVLVDGASAERLPREARPLVSWTGWRPSASSPRR